MLALLFALYPLALPGVWPAFALIAVVGLPGAAVNAGFFTLLQLRAPEPIAAACSARSPRRPRSRAWHRGGWHAGHPVGVIPLVSIQGAMHIVAGPLVLARLRRVAAPQGPRSRRK